MGGQRAGGSSEQTWGACPGERMLAWGPHQCIPAALLPPAGHGAPGSGNGFILAGLGG